MQLLSTYCGSFLIRGRGCKQSQRVGKRRCALVGKLAFLIASNHIFQIFPSPEDYELIKNEKEKEKKIREGAAGNPEIERVRR